MQVGIAQENKTSLELCKYLFGGIPVVPNWRIAIPYTGCEQSPMDIKGGVLFNHDGFAGHINAISYKNLSEEDFRDITSSISLYLHKHGVDTLLIQCLPSDIRYTGIILSGRFKEFDRRFSSTYTLTEHIANQAKDFSKICIASVQENDSARFAVQEMLQEMKGKVGYNFRRHIVDFEFWNQVKLACYVINDTVVGFALFSTLYDGEQGKVIHMVYTLPQYRGNGIGTRLVDFAKFCLGPGEISVIDFYFADAPQSFFENCNASLESTVYGVFASDFC